MQFRKLDLASLGRGSLLSGFTSGHNKLTLLSGRYFGRVVTFGTLHESNSQQNRLQTILITSKGVSAFGMF